MANPNADLTALAVRRSADPDPEVRPPRRWGSRVVVPGLLLAGFAGLAGWSAWDLVAPPRAVTVVPVVVRTGVTDEPAGRELFKANGWVEPRPLPVDVPVQTAGAYRVTEVKVNPGDRVRAGQVLLVLDDAAARLDVEAAEKQLAKRRAAAESARAGVAKAGVAARTAAEAVGLAKREGEADVKAQQADVTKAEAQLAAADLAVAVEEDLRQSSGLSSDVKVRQARRLRDVAAAEAASAAAKLAKATTAADVRVRQADAGKSAAGADLAAAKAKLAEAEQDAADAGVGVKRAELELARTRVVAPIDGAVMQLHARAGTVLGGGRGGGPDGKDLAATLYDPKRLQVRVEVPVARFALVRPGRPAVVELEDVLPGVELRGEVLADTRLANVARNSVPVKVALPDDPPEQLRPEMLAAVRFLAPASHGRKSEAARRLVVPRRLLVADGDAVRVWVVDPVAGRADLRPVELAPGERDRAGESAEVVGGLQPSDKLIASGRDGLTPGARVRVVGEER